MACDHIDDNDRLIYVEPETVKRCVLLEDFTGQKCVNCPRGTKVIEQLQEAYGEGIIAVGIHSGPLGFKGNATALGLATDLGDEYYNHWQLEYQPVGLINRHGAVNYTDWMTKVREEMTKTSTIDISLDALLSGNQITITVSEWSIAAYDGKLQIWVLEDSITATQTRHDPIDDDNVTINDKNYVHNHVLRCAVNGSWGESVTLAAGEPKTQTYQQAVDAAWNAAHLSIVAFVYNDNGVEQAIRKVVR
jgi:hypothetical protein